MTRLEIVTRRLEMLASEARGKLKALGYPADPVQAVDAMESAPDTNNTRLRNKYRRAHRLVAVLVNIDHALMAMGQEDWIKALDNATAAVAASMRSEAEIGHTSLNGSRTGAAAKKAMFADRNREWIRIAEARRAKNPRLSISSIAAEIAAAGQVKTETVRTVLKRRHSKNSW